ncbi:MAG: heterodisulfide reductase-related iron-sulfur binding cluster, partial [Planctomycetaceae bacterium]
AEAAVDCNGCATCRVPDEHGRMCPFVDDESEELLSPRAKANLLRQALCHPDSKGLLQSESARRIVESCFNCRQCQLECPSEVNIPHALVEARAQFFRQHGHSRSSWLLSRIHTYAGLLSRFAFPGNQLLRSRVVRRLLQRFLGLAANRRLPAFARRSFLDSARVQRPDNTGAPGSARPTVVYFVDYFSNHHDTELAEAFVRVLEHNGFRVFVPREQTISGMNMISVADLTAARDVAEQNLRELAEPAREGYPILCTEPSAALCLKQDYPRITANQDAEVVARQTLDAGTFLLELYRQGRLKTDFAPIPLTIAWHTPCHIRALTPTVASLELLRLIPELKVLEIEKGCTGMAGTFGLASENFSTSLKIGEKLISAMATIDADAGATDCSSCRMQMEQGAEIPTLHPIKLLALSYGLMPRLARQLKSRPSGLSMS